MTRTQKLSSFPLGVVVLAVYLAGFPSLASASLLDDMGIPTPSAHSIMQETTSASDGIFSDVLDSALQNPPAQQTPHQEAAPVIVCDTFGTLGLPGGCGQSGNGGGGSGGGSGNGGTDGGDNNTGGDSGSGDNGSEDDGDGNMGGGTGGSGGGTGGSGTGNDDDASDDDETGSSGSTSGGSSGGGGGGGIPSLFGQVNGGGNGPLATTAQCVEYLTDYIKYGQSNSPAEVTKLQTVLRDIEHFNILVTGVYDVATYEAVKQFQARYADDVLLPWGITAPTGYVYYTTKKKVNEVYCNNQRAFPLSQEQQAEIVDYVEGGTPASGPVGGTEVAEALAQASTETTSQPTEGTIEIDAASQVGAAAEGAEQSGLLQRIRGSLRSFFGNMREMLPF